MNWRISTGQKVLLIGMFPLLCQLLFVGLLMNVIGNIVNAQVVESKFQQIAVLTHTISLECQDMIVFTLFPEGEATHNESDFSQTFNEVQSGFDELSTMSQSYPELATKLADVKAALINMTNVIQYIDRTDKTALGRSHAYSIQKDKALTQVEQRLFDSIKPVVEFAELNRARRFEDVKRTQERLYSLLLLALPCSLIISVVPTWIIIMGVIRPIKRITQNSKNLAVGKLPDKWDTPTNDEIGDFEGHFLAISTAIVESNQREEKLIKSVLDVICTVDKDGKILQINKSVETLLGIAPDRAIGTYVSDIASQGSRSAAHSFFQSLDNSVSECELIFKQPAARLLKPSGHASIQKAKIPVLAWCKTSRKKEHWIGCG